MPKHHKHHKCKPLKLGFSPAFWKFDEATKDLIIDYALPPNKMVAVRGDKIYYYPIDGTPEQLHTITTENGIVKSVECTPLKAITT